MSDQTNGTVPETTNTSAEQTAPRPEVSKAQRKAAERAAKEAKRAAVQEDDDKPSPLDTAAFCRTLKGETRRKLKAADGTQIQFVGSLDTDDPEELAELMEQNEEVRIRFPAAYRASIEMHDNASKTVKGETGAYYIRLRADAIRERNNS